MCYVTIHAGILKEAGARIKCVFSWTYPLSGLHKRLHIRIAHTEYHMQTHALLRLVHLRCFIRSSVQQKADVTRAVVSGMQALSFPLLNVTRL